MPTSAPDVPGKALPKPRSSASLSPGLAASLRRSHRSPGRPAETGSPACLPGTVFTRRRAKSLTRTLRRGTTPLSTRWHQHSGNGTCELRGHRVRAREGGRPCMVWARPSWAAGGGSSLSPGGRTRGWMRCQLRQEMGQMSHSQARKGSSGRRRPGALGTGSCDLQNPPPGSGCHTVWPSWAVRVHVGPWTQSSQEPRELGWHFRGASGWVPTRGKPQKGR